MWEKLWNYAINILHFEVLNEIIDSGSYHQWIKPLLCTMTDSDYYKGGMRLSSHKPKDRQ